MAHIGPEQQENLRKITNEIQSSPDTQAALDVIKSNTPLKEIISRFKTANEGFNVNEQVYEDLSYKALNFLVQKAMASTADPNPPEPGIYHHVQIPFKKIEETFLEDIDAVVNALDTHISGQLNMAKELARNNATHAREVTDIATVLKNHKDEIGKQTKKIKDSLDAIKTGGMKVSDTEEKFRTMMKSINKVKSEYDSLTNNTAIEDVNKVLGGKTLNFDAATPARVEAQGPQETNQLELFPRPPATINIPANPGTPIGNLINDANDTLTLPKNTSGDYVYYRPYNSAETVKMRVDRLLTRVPTIDANLKTLIEKICTTLDMAQELKKGDTNIDLEAKLKEATDLITDAKKARSKTGETLIDSAKITELTESIRAKLRKGAGLSLEETELLVHEQKELVKKLKGEGGRVTDVKTNVDNIEIFRNTFAARYKDLKDKAIKPENTPESERHRFLREYELLIKNPNRLQGYFPDAEFNEFSRGLKKYLKDIHKDIQGDKNYGKIVLHLYKEIRGWANVFKLRINLKIDDNPLNLNENGVKMVEAIRNFNEQAKAGGHKLDENLQSTIDLILGKISPKTELEQLNNAWTEITKAEVALGQTLRTAGGDKKTLQNAKEKVDKAYNDLYALEMKLMTPKEAYDLRKKIRGENLQQGINNATTAANTLIGEINTEIKNKDDKRNEILVELGKGEKTDPELKSFREQLDEIQIQISQLEALRNTKQLEIEAAKEQGLAMPEGKTYEEIHKNVVENTAMRFSSGNWLSWLSSKLAYLRYANRKKAKNIFKREKQLVNYLQTVRDKGLFREQNMAQGLMERRREKKFVNKAFKYKNKAEKVDKNLDLMVGILGNDRKIERLKRKYGNGVRVFGLDGMSPFRKTLTITADDKIWECGNIKEALKLSKKILREKSRKNPVATTIDDMQKRLIGILEKTMKVNKKAMSKLLEGIFSAKDEAVNEQAENKKTENEAIKTFVESLNLGILYPSTGKMLKIPREGHEDEGDRLKWLAVMQHQDFNLSYYKPFFVKFIEFWKELPSEKKNNYNFDPANLQVLWKIKKENPNNFEEKKDFNKDFERLVKYFEDLDPANPEYKKVKNIKTYLDYRKDNPDIKVPR